MTFLNFLSACGFNGTRNEGELSSLSSLNDTLVQSICDGNFSMFERKVSREYKSHKSSLNNRTFSEISNNIESCNFYVLDSCYFPESSDLGVVERIFKKDSLGEYEIRFKTNGNECYFVNLVIELIDKSELILSVIYERSDRNTDWKIRSLYVSSYSIEGVKYLDYLEKSLRLRDQGHLLGSFYNYDIALSGTTFQKGDIMEYTLEAQVYQLTRDLEQIKTNNLLPLVLDDDDLEIEIVDFLPYQSKYGWKPVFVYLSEKDINDTLLMRTENDILHQKIDSIYKGIASDFDTLLYRVYRNPFDNGSNVGFLKHW